MSLRRTGLLPSLVGIMLLLVAGSSMSATSQLDAARACVHEPARLDRLACFDQVFGTPVSAARYGAESRIQRPADWRLAYALEANRRPEDGVLYQGAGHQAGHLITIAALGAVPPRPLLTVQCQNNITELKLMLPKALDRDRVALSFDTAGGREQQLWRVRDQGLIVSGGRGLPAIRTIKRLAGRTQLELSSTEPRVNGLVFDLGGLAEKLKPLRQACGW